MPETPTNFQEQLDAWATMARGWGQHDPEEFNKTLKILIHVLLDQKVEHDNALAQSRELFKQNEVIREACECVLDKMQQHVNAAQMDAWVNECIAQLQDGIAAAPLRDWQQRHTTPQPGAQHG